MSRRREPAGLNPPGQYADDRNLSARQRLWQCQVPPFDLAVWVLDLAVLEPGMRVLDAGCGNGLYLRALGVLPVRAVGCDLSPGMLRTVTHRTLVNADVTALPVRDGAFDVVLAAHMLDLVPDRDAAVRELRRALAPGGTCVAVTNRAQHLRSLRDLIEQAASVSTPDWRMRAPTGSAFTAENAAAQLGVRSKGSSRPPGSSAQRVTWPPSSAGNTGGPAAARTSWAQILVTARRAGRGRRPGRPR